MIDAPPGRIDLWLASRYENIELVLALLDQLCKERGIDSETEHWIGMALREGVANAVKHGNRLDPGKRVHVTFGGPEGEFLCEIGDEGEGFDVSTAPDPLAPENQMKTSGRGIFYMKSFMDEVSHSRRETGGTLVTLRKKLKSREG
jgi:serine/threonine-protein kinase RsbW